MANPTGNKRAPRAGSKGRDTKSAVPPLRRCVTGDPPKQFPCPKCDKMFRTKIGLENHQEVDHPEDFFTRAGRTVSAPSAPTRATRPASRPATRVIEEKKPGNASCSTLSLPSTSATADRLFVTETKSISLICCGMGLWA
mmetsp:Transcript_81119/g.185755  ORF Transcript_81119/g.185755 Transcript_81119/m.185755 type:complete len:140 (+) Transcript_81119:71-490(+)